MSIVGERDSFVIAEKVLRMGVEQKAADLFGLNRAAQPDDFPRLRRTIYFAFILSCQAFPTSVRTVLVAVV